MIHIDATLIAISDVPSFLPAKQGRRLHISAVYRWMQKGIKGIKLDYVTIGGTRFTSPEALQKFAEQITKVRDEPVLLRGHSAIRERQIAMAKQQVGRLLNRAH